MREAAAYFDALRYFIEWSAQQRIIDQLSAISTRDERHRDHVPPRQVPQPRSSGLTRGYYYRSRNAQRGRQSAELACTRMRRAHSEAVASMTHARLRRLSEAQQMDISPWHDSVVLLPAMMVLLSILTLLLFLLCLERCIL